MFEEFIIKCDEQKSTHIIADEYTESILFDVYYHEEIQIYHHRKDQIV